MSTLTDIYELLDFPIPDSLKDPEPEDASASDEESSKKAARDGKPKPAGDSIDPGMLGLEGA